MKWIFWFQKVVNKDGALLMRPFYLFPFLIDT